MGVSLCGKAGDGHHRGLVTHLAEQAGGCDHVTGDVHAVASIAGRPVAPCGAGQVDGAGLAVQGELPPPAQAVAPADVADLEEGFEASHGLAEVLVWPDACLGLDQRFSRGRDIMTGDAVVLGEAGLVEVGEDERILPASGHRDVEERGPRPRPGQGGVAEALADRAVACGVRIQAGEKVTAATFPGGPTVVATRLPAASRLLERELRWPGARTALMDVAASPGQRRWPGTVIDIRGDLRTCCLVDRLTATFPDLVGDRGADLFQAQLGISRDTSRADATARIERTFDEAARGWRDRVVWQRSLILADATGAVDPPGATWRDRPAIDRGDDRFLAGDAVAAPGMLSEVAVNSGIDAARRALAARRHRVFAPGWPTAELTPARRLAVLAAALPGGCAITADRPDGEAHPWSGSQADQTGIGYRLAMRAGVLRGEATSPQPDGTRTTVLAWNRLPGRAGRLVSRWLARRWE